jgi:hypothetical protein
MKPQNYVLLAATIVLLGRWSQGKKVTAGIVVGGLFSALLISIMSSAAPKLAKGFALLFLVGASLTYIGPLLTNTTK